MNSELTTTLIALVVNHCQEHGIRNGATKPVSELQSVNAPVLSAPCVPKLKLPFDHGYWVVICCDRI